MKKHQHDNQTGDTTRVQQHNQINENNNVAQLNHDRIWIIVKRYHFES